jgi:hypothetical protein
VCPSGALLALVGGGGLREGGQQLLHYNYKYDWLRLKLKEIVAAYLRLYGRESRDSDN